MYLYVNDRTNPSALLAEEWVDLQNLCGEVDELSSAEIAILVVNTTQPHGIDTFAVETFAQNAIGKKGLDNGVLLLVSVDERAWRVEVGYGLEGILNDAKVGRWGNELLAPALNASDYYTGIYDLTLALGQEIVDHYDPGTNRPPPGQPWVTDWTPVIAGLLLIGAVGVLSRGRIAMRFPNLGPVFRRGGFGGGRSGGGGARGKF